MASEVSHRHTGTGDTLYFTIRNTSRQMWNTAGTPNFETLTVANWGDYDVAMTESPASSYFYVGTFPAISGNMVAGWYWVDVFEQAGGSPAISDTMLCSYFGYWDGTTFSFWGTDVRAVSEDVAAANNLESACDNYSATRGLAGTALPAAAADAAGGLPISDAGGLDLDTILDVAISTRLAPTTSSRTLDVTAGGCAGIDWNNIENKTAAVDLSATDIQLCDTTTNLTNKTGFALASGGLNGVTQSSGGVLVTTNGITATSIATDAIDADALAADAIAEINATVDTALSDYDAPTKTEMDAAFTEIKGATWSSTTDTLEALRDRGDAAWITATSVTVSDKTGFSLAADQSGVTIGTVNALASAAVTDIWATDTLTESYAADGAAATPAQLMYMLWSAVSEFAIASTTITCKKLDGSTTAMTFTLDSATVPTSRTRAT